MKLLQDIHELVVLLRENNNLLRELILETTGKPSKTVQPRSQKPIRQFTDKDVKVITREMRMRMDQEAQEQPIWREKPLTHGGGPDSETTSPSDGLKSNGAARNSIPNE